MALHRRPKPAAIIVNHSLTRTNSLKNLLRPDHALLPRLAAGVRIIITRALRRTIIIANIPGFRTEATRPRLLTAPALRLCWVFRYMYAKERAHSVAEPRSAFANCLIELTCHYGGIASIMMTGTYRRMTAFWPKRLANVLKATTVLFRSSTPASIVREYHVIVI